MNFCQGALSPGDLAVSFYHSEDHNSEGTSGIDTYPDRSRVFAISAVTG